MKHCPTCQRTFIDDSLSFCTEDGTPLSPLADDEATRVVPNSQNPGSWSQPGYQPPSSQPARQRKNAPWIFVVILAMVLGIVSSGIVLLLKLPSMRQRQQSVTPPPADTNINANTNSPVYGDASRNQNANTSDPETPAPTDNKAVLADLTALEHDWTVANLNADKNKLDEILADDYVGAASDGHMQGKAEYIDTIERDTSIEKWNFEDLKLTLRGERATLSGKIRLVNGDTEQVLNFTDRFVWRDGRWQATGSEVRPEPSVNDQQP
jgi:hypothetical protein